MKVLSNWQAHQLISINEKGRALTSQHVGFQRPPRANCGPYDGSWSSADDFAGFRLNIYHGLIVGLPIARGRPCLWAYAVSSLFSANYAEINDELLLVRLSYCRSSSSSSSFIILNLQESSSPSYIHTKNHSLFFFRFVRVILSEFVITYLISYSNTLLWDQFILSKHIVNFPIIVFRGFSRFGFST